MKSEVCTRACVCTPSSSHTHTHPSISLKRLGHRAINRPAGITYTLQAITSDWSRCGRLQLGKTISRRAHRPSIRDPLHVEATWITAVQESPPPSQKKSGITEECKSQKCTFFRGLTHTKTFICRFDPDAGSSRNKEAKGKSFQLMLTGTFSAWAEAPGTQ